MFSPSPSIIKFSKPVDMHIDDGKDPEKQLETEEINFNRHDMNKLLGKVEENRLLLMSILSSDNCEPTANLPDS